MSELEEFEHWVQPPYYESEGIEAHRGDEGISANTAAAGPAHSPACRVLFFLGYLLLL